MSEASPGSASAARALRPAAVLGSGRRGRLWLAAAPRPGRRGRWWLAAALLTALAALVVAHLTTRVPASAVQPQGVYGRRWHLFELICLWWLLFLAGATCLLRVPRRLALPAVAVVAVALRLAALAPVTPLSDDMYRYAWDGRVQAAGIDPYRYPPADPALDRLHSGWLWPDPAGCARLHRRPGCSRLNREKVRTVYPPAAQAVFTVEHLVIPGTTRDRGYEVAGLLLDLAVLAVLLSLLRSWGRDPRWLVLYAWCPTVVLEAVQNAHVDVLAALLVLLVLRESRRRPVLAATLVAVAALVKLYPAVLLALVLRRRPFATVGAFLGIVVLGYLPHVLAVGAKVVGYLPGYLREEQYGNGAGYLLLSPLGLPATATSALAVLLLGAVGLWVLLDRTSADDVRARRLLGALLLVATPGASWYALPVLAVVALSGAWWWLPLGFAAYPTYFAQGLAQGGQAAAAAGYAFAALVLAVVAALRLAGVPGPWQPRSPSSPGRVTLKRRHRLAALSLQPDHGRPDAPAVTASARRAARRAGWPA